MNSVSLIGTLTAPPTLRNQRDEVPTCRMCLAVPRRDRDGRPAPGVVYVEVIAVGDEAQECAQRLERGHRIGLAGRLERDEWRQPSGGWVVAYRVLIDQLDFLDEAPELIA